MKSILVYLAVAVVAVVIDRKTGIISGLMSRIGL